MKKLLLAATVAALSATVAQAAPTVYGKAFLTFDINQYDTDTTITTTNIDATTGASTTTTTTSSSSSKGRLGLNSNSSRIGFKGSEAVSPNTDLVYQLEYGVDVDADTNGKGQFYARDAYLGLSNKQFGTVLAGQLSAIDGMVDYANVTAGRVLGGDNVLATFDSPRANNAVAYVSPNYNGVSFLGMYVMDEFNNITVPSLELTRDVYGVGVKYEPANAPLKAGATYIQAGDVKIARVSGGYQVSPAVGVGALYQHTNFGKGAEKENAFTVSGTYGIANTPWTTYAQVDLVDNAVGVKDASKQRVALGGKYAFSSQATGHVYGAYLNTEASETISNPVLTANRKTEASGVGIGAGLEYKF